MFFVNRGSQHALSISRFTVPAYSVQMAQSAVKI